MLSTRPLVKFSVEHPWLIIIASILITATFAVPLMNLKIQSDVESLLPKDMEEFEDNTSTEAVLYDKLLIMVSGDSLFTVANLQLFEKTYEELSNVLPVVEIADPFSMLTLLKSGAKLTAVPLAPEGRAPANEDDLNIFIQRLSASRFAPGAVSSVNRDALAVYLLVEKTSQYVNMIDDIDLTLKPLREAVDVSVTGTIPFSAETERFLTEGFVRLLILVIATILISYYLGFRSKRAVFLPITLVISGTIFALGIMSLAGFELTMVSIISPPLILTLGSSYSIHVMNSYYSASRESDKTKKELIVSSVSSISGTVLLASFTTLIGLMSLMFASIVQTREFAVSTALGISFSALLSITLLPAFLVLQPVPTKKKLKLLNMDPLSRFLRRYGPALARARVQTIIIIIIITAVFFMMLPQIEFNTSPSKYFPENSAVIKNISNYIAEIGGYEELEIQLSGPEKNYFLKQEVLENINDFEKQLISNPDISYVFSFPQYLDYAAKVMTGKERNFSSRGLNLYVSRMFSAINSNNDIVNDDYSRISILIRFFNKEKMMPADENDIRALKISIGNLLDQEFDQDINWVIKGQSLGFLKLSDQMKRDFLVSTIAALLLIGSTASIAFRSIVKGLLTLVPLLMGIFSSMILMVIFNIPLDMTTIMVSSITIGVGVDDSIHFLLQHTKYSKQFPDDSIEAIRQTLIHSGRPILITTLSIVAGLIFLSFAQFQPIRYFGLLIVFTLLTACFSTIVLLPSLVRLSDRKNA